MFVDHIKVYARAGNGGNGVATFRREAFVPRGGPDGGDGGRGGDVVLVADHNTDSLRSFFYQPNMLAEHGAHGGKQKRTGRSGKSVVHKVPVGTLVFSCRTQQPGKALEEEKDEMIADLIEPGQQFVLAQGGVGGKGNVHFKSSTNQVPMEFTEGEPGDEGYFFLELRRIADVGLVGFPNAGKSTLTGVLSGAKPKVGNYPFTTLQPSVGVMEFDRFRRATVADIPGLIEGAHDNVGLGHEFLRHIMRCSLLAFVVDAAGSEMRDPVQDLEVLRKEVKLHDEHLAKRPWLIVANKIDLPEAQENLARLIERFPKIEVFPVSAELEEGIEPLKKRLDELVGQGPGSGEGVEG